MWEKELRQSPALPDTKGGGKEKLTRDPFSKCFKNVFNIFYLNCIKHI